MSAQKQKNHRPFLIRKSIFFGGLAAGLFSAYFLESYLLGLCVYFGTVTIADLLATYAFGLRASSFSDPKQLLLHEKISILELDMYYDSRRNIRVLSLVLAGLSQLVALSPELFCAVYVGVSLVSVFYAWYKLDLEGPKSFHLTGEKIDMSFSTPAFQENRAFEQYDHYKRSEDNDIALGYAGVGRYSYLSPEPHNSDYRPFS